MRKYSFLVGSNHKTGTVWMAQITGDMARDTGRHFENISFRDINENDVSKKPVVLFDHYSIFRDPGHHTSGMRGFTIVRHPKDQIISATRYHHTSVEDWLHEPIDRFNGKTYQQQINSIEGWDNKVIFEMKNASLFHTHNMLSHDTRLMRIKYEDLISQYPYPDVFNDLFDYLKFDEEDAQSFVKNYLSNHINQGYKSDHVLDGSIEQYKKYWTPRCEQVYGRLYGDIASHLGYN
jgi:hypothetical protein